MYEFALGFGLLSSLCVLLAFSRSAAFNLFHPLSFYSAFHILVFVIRPIFADIQGFDSLYYAYGFSPSPDDKLTVILAANLGYVAFAFFSLRAGDIPFIFKGDALRQIERQRLLRVFPWVIAICGPIGIYSLVTGLNADDSGVVLAKGTGTFIHTDRSGYVEDAQLMLVALSAYCAWLGRFRLLSLLPIAAFIVLRGATGGRGPFIAALTITGLLYLYDKRQHFPGYRMSLVALATIALFVWIGNDRGQSLRNLSGLQNGSEATQHRDQKFMETMDLANMEFFEYIVWVVPQRSGTYDYFLNNLQLLTEPIPRATWPDKPIGPPIQPVSLWAYGSPIGMTSSLPGMGWYSMGWLGVVIWCGLWGHGLGWLYRRYCLSDQSTLRTAAYMTLMGTLMVAYRDGSLVSLARQSVPFLLPVLIWHLLARLSALPSLSQIRQAHIATPGQTMSGAPAGSPSPLLPPAVQRRRMALNSLKADLLKPDLLKADRSE